MNDDLTELFEKAELGALLGDNGVLRSSDRRFEGFERSMDRARKLLGEVPDPEIFRPG